MMGRVEVSMNKKMIKLYSILIMSIIALSFLMPNIFSMSHGFTKMLAIKAKIIFSNEISEKIIVDAQKSNIIIMFDDGWESQYNVAFKYMSEKNMRGSISVITSYVGKHKYMSKSELFEVYANGWDILNHTVTHKHLSKLSKNNQIKEIVKADEWLNDNGLISDYKVLIYPYGDYSEETTDIVKKHGFLSARNTKSLYNEKFPKSFFEINAFTVFTDTDKKEIVEWIDFSRENDKTLILLFHEVCDVTNDLGMQYDKRKFKDIIDYIEALDDVNVLTYTDWINASIQVNEK